MKTPRTDSRFSQPEPLSLKDCLAKTYLGPENETLAGVDVLTHCRIVGEVARELVSLQPIWLREALFPTGSELIAAAHDVGKISPTFQKKIDKALNRTRSGWEGVDPDLEKSWGGHSAVSEAATEGIGSFIPQILGRHHGTSPELGLRNKTTEVFGGLPWQERREELLQALKEHLGVEWPQVGKALQATALSGLTTVADWIGSGSLFEHPGQDWRLLPAEAVRRAGFLQPRIRGGLTFRQIFDFEARPVQSQLIESCTGPGVYVLEAPMGLGKTEAALFAAYRVLEQGLATGIYFALPTQLTSNKIYQRVNTFLEHIIEPDETGQRARLVHSNAQLWEDLELGEDGKPGGSWFSSTKRGLLAPFAVGTIDQALMAVMNVKHGFVRAFGLAGKVVILDEVHSYDSFTGTLLDALVKDLVGLHCTVIILSATLTRSRRRAFVGTASIGDGGNDPYPLISAHPQRDPVMLLPAEPIPSAEVKLAFVSDEELAVEEALERAEKGQQILWIENTVVEAQERFKTLAARVTKSVDCGLLHSRFVKSDRQINEDYWVTLYGPKGQFDRGKRGRILVGTQVVEQSLDIDADFLVTRLAPTDMLLQRLGRLWRHRANDVVRPQSACQEAWILASPYFQAVAHPEAILGKSAFVYAPYVLLRTLNVWESLSNVQIPGQIRSLLEATYAEQSDNGIMARYKAELETKRQKLQGLARVGLSQGGKTLPERVATRYSEMDTVEVLLIRRMRKNDEGVFVTFTDNEELFLPKQPWTRGWHQWRKVASRLAIHTVTVSERTAPPLIAETALAWLKPYVFLNDDFRIAQVGSANEVVSFVSIGDSFEGATYDSVLGYQFKKGESEWSRS